MKHKEAFNGVVVLTAALIVIKILSAVYRIPYQNILGDTGLYAYQQVYPIVALGMILSMNAIPSAITQNIGKYHSDEAYAKAVAYIQLVGTIMILLLFLCLRKILHMMVLPFNTNDSSCKFKLYIYRYAWRVKRLLSICK